MKLATCFSICESNIFYNITLCDKEAIKKNSAYKIIEISAF